jgi:spermidine synthase
VPGDAARRARAVRLPSGQRAVAPRVTISEEDGIRFLHFGTEWVQGAMRIARPFALELNYQQQMMAPLVFLPQPRRVVQLGLGAGALAKYCWRELPQATVTVVEISEAVVATATQWFKLPQDDRLEVVVQDAREFISHPRRRRSADWLQVDLYDAAARGPVYGDEGFYAACRAALKSPGIAAFNLFGRRFEHDFAPIARAFDDRAVVLPEADAGNRVVLAFTGPPLDVPFADLMQRARAIETRFRLPARKWIVGIRSENGYSGRLQV